MTGNLSYFQELLNSIITHGSKLPIPGLEKFEPKTASLAELANLVLETRGEASAIVHAEQLFDRFEQADHEQRLAFFKVLLHEYDLDTAELATL